MRSLSEHLNLLIVFNYIMFNVSAAALCPVGKLRATARTLHIMQPAQHYHLDDRRDLGRQCGRYNSLQTSLRQAGVGVQMARPSASPRTPWGSLGRPLPRHSAR